MTRSNVKIAWASASVMAVALGSVAHAERHYDCTKPGNANRAACKAAASAPGAPAAAPAPPTSSPAARSSPHYDCSKAGNANKAACKGAAPTSPTTPPAATPAKPSIFSRIMKSKTQPAAAPAPAGSAAPTAAVSTAAVGSYKGKSITTDAAGATGQCRDGTYTHATHHSGACSSHGGVAKWM